MIKELSETEARELIESAKMGRLGCIFQGEPYVVPLNYLLEDKWIYGHSLPGQKLSALRANPRACLQVDQVVDDFHWRSAIAFGNFEEVADPEDRAEVMRKLLVLFPNLTPVESRIAGDGAPPEIVVFRLGIDKVTGVSEG